MAFKQSKEDHTGWDQHIRAECKALVDEQWVAINALAKELLQRTTIPGDPRSPYYGNLLKGWAEEGAFPLLYSREKVLAHKAITIQLSPK